MPSLRWIVVLAIVLGCLLAFLIKSGLTVRTGEESAIRPGQPVEIYPEQVTSTYLRTKEKLREIQKTKDEQSFWGK